MCAYNCLLLGSIYVGSRFRRIGVITMNSAVTCRLVLGRGSVCSLAFSGGREEIRHL